MTPSPPEPSRIGTTLNSSSVARRTTFTATWGDLVAGGPTDENARLPYGGGGGISSSTRETPRKTSSVATYRISKDVKRELDATSLSRRFLPRRLSHLLSRSKGPPEVIPLPVRDSRGDRRRRSVRSTRGSNVVTSDNRRYILDDRGDHLCDNWQVHPRLNEYVFMVESGPVITTSDVRTLRPWLPVFCYSVNQSLGRSIGSRIPRSIHLYIRL